MTDERRHQRDLPLILEYGQHLHIGSRTKPGIPRAQGKAAGVGLISGETLGIYNITALADARGQGAGTAVTSSLLHLVAERGCTHAILQMVAAS